MSRTEILDELAKMSADERLEIFERLCDLREQDLINGNGPTPEEKAILDKETEEYQRDQDDGVPLPEVDALIRKFIKK